MGRNKTGGPGFEESLTEDQLLARIDTALVWNSRAWKLSAKSEQEKASPGKVATWKELAEYSQYVERISDMILRIKLTDRLASLMPQEKEALLREWGSAEPDSYECRKRGKCSGVISKKQALETAREIRAKLKAKHAVYCTAARAFEIPEDDEFFPGHGTLLPRPNQPKKKRVRASLDKTTHFRRWIAEILVRIGTDASALDVAKEIKLTGIIDWRVEEQYRGDGKTKYETVYSLLLANRTVKKRFENLVSDVKSLMKSVGN